MRTQRFLAITIAALILAAGCSNNPTSSNPDTDSDPPDTETTQPSQTSANQTTTTDRPAVTVPDSFPDVDTEIIQRYLAYHEATLVAAGKPEANPDYAPLYEYTIDPQASTERERAERLKREGHVVIDPPNSETSHAIKFAEGTAFTEEKQEGQTIVLLDCYVEALVIESLEGEELSDQVVTYVLAVEMQVSNGEWRVAAVDHKKQYEGVNTCDDYES